MTWISNTHSSVIIENQIMFIGHFCLGMKSGISSWSIGINSWIMLCVYKNSLYHVDAWRSGTVLTLVLDGSELSASLSSHFTPRKGAPCTHQIGDWVVPRLVWMQWQREKFLPILGIKTILQPVVNHCTKLSWPII